VVGGDGTAEIRQKYTIDHYVMVNNVIAYRVPTEAKVYMTGSFFGGTGKQPIGRYPAGSREAQILALLHEIAHNIVKNPRGPKGVEYLIPPDGDNRNQSSESTNLIRDTCRTEILNAAK
jgi:hypothetical protein